MNQLMSELETPLTQSMPLAEPGPGEMLSVLFTRSNYECQVARSCEYLRVRHYLPVTEFVEAGGSGVRHLPLFPGYLFACTDYGSETELRATGSVVRVIPVHRPGLLLRELREVDAALKAWRGVASGPALSQGRRVRVKCGPLAGIEGLVRHRRFRQRRERLVLNVSLLGQAATLDIEARHLEPC